MAAVIPLAVGAGDIALTPVSTYPALPEPDAFGQGASETVAFDAITQSLLVTNGMDNTIDIIDMTNPKELVNQLSVDLTPYGSAPTDVVVHDGLTAVTVQNEEKIKKGIVLLFDVASAIAGDLGPEGMVFISADNSPTGQPFLAVANEVSGTTTLYQIDAIPQPVHRFPKR